MFIFCCLVFLLFGLFECYFFAVWARACFIFLLFGRERGPGPNSKKKNTPPPKQQKKKTRPAPSERVVVFAVWAGGRVIFFAVWAGGVFFLLFGPRACHFFLLFGPGGKGGGCGPFFFAVWAGGVLFFLLLRRVACFFCCLGGHRSAWLVFKRPNNKKDQAANKKHGFRFGVPGMQLESSLKIDHKGASILQTQKVEPYYGNIDCMV